MATTMDRSEHSTVWLLVQNDVDEEAPPHPEPNPKPKPKPKPKPNSKPNPNPNPCPNPNPNPNPNQARHVALGSFARIRHRASGKYLVIADAPEDDGASLRSAGTTLRRGASAAASAS